jgi:membrane protein implicated in regulation of membrane protease activity
VPRGRQLSRGLENTWGPDHRNRQHPARAFEVTSLHVLFLAAFIGGLLLAVFAMLHGVEYTRRNRSRAPSPLFNVPSVAAFAVAFGAVGYPLASRTRMSGLTTLLIAAVSGAAATAGMVVLLARWALRKTSTPHEDEEIQGQFAVVLEEITRERRGEISYEHSGERLRIPARALGDATLPVGSEVVIERIENGVAFVEAWAVVEQRL